MNAHVAGFARGRPVALAPIVAAWWWAPASVLLSVLAWPIGSLRADTINAYWQVGLHMAAMQGLEPGRDVVFTYGPLGFLAFPLLVGSTTAVAAFVFAAVVHTALIAVVLQAARKRLPWPAALAIAAVAAVAPVPLADVPVLLVLAACLRTLESAGAPSSSWVVPAGAAAAFELLVKTNDGLVCLVLLALAAWRLRPGRIRAELALAVSFMVSLALLWRSTHGRLADLPQWARLSAHLVASYAQGMQLRGPGHATLIAAALVAVSAMLALVQARMLGGARGAALWLAVALFAFAFFKEGFVRQDAAHTTVFYAALAVALLLVDWETPVLRACALLLAAATVAQLGPRDRVAEAVLVAVAAWLVFRAHRPSFLRSAPLVAAAAAALVVVGSSGPHLVYEVLPESTLGHAVAQVRLLANGTARTEAIAASRAAIRATTPLSSAMLSELRGHSVDVEQLGATVAWAYGLDWHPEPLLESYAAYDPSLDGFAAASLAASGAERILLAWTAIDGQNPLWQAPALVLTELCRYRRAGGDAGGPMVAARAANRCGTARLLSSTNARPGHWVDVPAAGAGDLVYASIQLRTGLLDVARSVALRPGPVSIEARGEGGGTFALVPASAADPLVMRLPHLRSLPAPQGGTAIDRFRVGGGGTAQIDFYAVHVRGAH
ncbi:MAG TPA: hypothetical protein VNC40_15965 [Gaiellaceae bacterium]|nr:hypothetical protein [Gaiellaceae bacterium]